MLGVEKLAVQPQRVRERHGVSRQPHYVFGGHQAFQPRGGDETLSAFVPPSFSMQPVEPFVLPLVVFATSSYVLSKSFVEPLLHHFEWIQR